MTAGRSTLAVAECSEPAIDADGPQRRAELSLEQMVQQTEQAFLEVAQRGTAWTTTSDGRMPLEIPLGSDADGVTRLDTIEERGKISPRTDRSAASRDQRSRFSFRRPNTQPARQ